MHRIARSTTMGVARAKPHPVHDRPTKPEVQEDKTLNKAGMSSIPPSSKKVKPRKFQR